MGYFMTEPDTAITVWNQTTKGWEEQAKDGKQRLDGPARWSGPEPSAEASSAAFLSLGRRAQAPG